MFGDRRRRFRVLAGRGENEQLSSEQARFGETIAIRQEERQETNVGVFERQSDVEQLRDVGRRIVEKTAQGSKGCRVR